MAVSLFDSNFYRSVNPDLASLNDAQAQAHFQQVGLLEGRQFSPFVNLNFYRAGNADLASLNNQQLFDHLQTYGVQEKRRFSEFVDLDLYQQVHADLSRFTGEQLLAHLQQWGIHEGRRFSQFVNLNFYRSNNEDLSGLSNSQLLTHLEQYGIREARQFSEFVDLGFYRSQNPDLAGLGNPDLLEHLQRYGLNEGRRFSPFVDLNWYRSNNADLSSFTGNQALLHLAVFGVNEGRSFSTAFDLNYYRTLNSDVAAGLSNLQLLQQFEQVGVNEGRVSASGFNSQVYLANNPDLSAAGLSYRQAFQHFVVYGYGEGRPGSDYAGNTLATARLGASTPLDFVGAGDNHDFYRFTISSPTDFNASITGVGTNVSLQLLGTMVGGISSASTGSQGSASIGGLLNPGTYYLQVSLASATQGTNYTLSSSIAQPTVTVIQPTVTIAATIPNAAEPSTPGQFTITRSGSTTTPLTVSYGVGGTATNGSDYSSIASSVTIAAGQSSAIIPIPVLDDSLIEGSETIVLSLNSNNAYTVGSSSSGTVTIADNDSSTDPGNTLGTAEVQNSAIFSRTEQVSSADRDDFYRFTIGESGVFTANLTGLSGDADVRLIRDIDSDGAIDNSKMYDSATGVLDQGEVLAWQWERGPTSESIRRFLSAGTYFVQVTSYNNQTANYNLSTGFTAAASDDRRFSITPTYGSGINATAQATIQKGINFWLNAIPYTSFSTSQNFTLNVVEDSSLTGVAAATGGYDSTAIDTNGRRIPTAGNMNLSPGYLNNLNTDSSYTPDIIIHEIGHALGLVDLLDSSTINAASGTYNANTYAGWSYGELKGTYTQTAVPLRAYAGGGDDLSHWKKEVFGSETMTHSIGAASSLSQLSLAVLRDLGWNINFGAAQPYTLPRGGTGTSLTTVVSNLGSGGSSGGYVAFSVSGESTDRLYKLSLSQVSSITMTLSGLSANADVRLIHDANNNSVIDAGEVIQVSANSGTSTETFNLTNLAAGTYFVNVYAGSSVDSAGNRLIDNTGYRLDYGIAAA